MPNLRGKTWTTTTPANVGDAQYWEDHLISDAVAAKAASSVQSVNNTAPDEQGNVDIVTLPDGGTAGQVLTKQSSVDGDADWEDPASSGHTIVDEDDTDMPYRTNLQFLNAEVTDDSVNDATVVDCKGSKGDPGDAATITVGTVTTLPAGSSATIVNSGTTSAAVFDFGIPKGKDGTGAVDSVNGQTGVVVLDAEDVGAIDTAGDGLAKEGTTIALDLGMLTGSNLTKAVSGKDIKDALDKLTEDTQELKYRVGILSAKVPYYVANATMPRKKTLSSAELTEARARAAEQDYKTVVPGDIIIGPNTGTEYYLAKCWGRKGVGDSQPTGGAALTPNLMLMLYKPHGITRLWAGYGSANKSWRVNANDLGRCPWNAAVDVDPTNSEAIGDNNTNITRAYDNNGTSVNVSGYMGSFIRKMLDERLLVDCFEADFGAANILPYRSMLGNAIKTDSPSGGHPAWNGLTNGWAWYTRKLDLPSEIELYGSIIWSSSGFDVGIQNEQLPFLKLGDIDLFFPRFDIWTKGVASGSSAAARYDIGYAGNVYASSAYWACPLACVK